MYIDIVIEQDRKLIEYSRHVRAHEQATLDFMQSCFAIFRELSGSYGGHVVKTMGDGALVEFPSAAAAVTYALSAQDRFKALAHTLPDDHQIRFRIGLHLGDVQERDGDLYGHIVNIASRLEALAEPGGICISQAVYEQVHASVPAIYRNLGPRALRNIGEPVVAYQLHRVSIEAAAASAISSSANHEGGDASVRATNRLAEVKREMDVLISRARHRRSLTSDSLILGIVKLAASPHVRHYDGSRTAASQESKSPSCAEVRVRNMGIEPVH